MNIEFFKVLDFSARNFRNLDSSTISFGEKINCILGNNGNGKTNLLEAIHYSLTNKTFKKNTSFEQLVSLDGDKPEIQIYSNLLNTRGVKNLYSTQCSYDKNTYFKDGRKTGTKQKGAIFFIGPFDSHSFHFIPKERRNWFDHIISVFSFAYAEKLKKHHHLIRARNKILGEGPLVNNKRDQLNAIDKELSKVIPCLVNNRIEFVNAVQGIYGDIFKKIFSLEYKITLHYATKFKDLSEEFVYNFLQSSLLKDGILGYTSYSVHKDDYTLLLNGLNSLDYASLGQQKISYMSLFLAALEVFKKKYEAYPVLLIDDMSSELDNERWQGLLAYLANVDIQVFITTANESFLTKMKDIEHSKCYKVESGKVLLIN